MDSSVDLSNTWKDCERHVEQLTQLVRQILSGETAAQQTAPALLERLDLLKASCRLAKGQSELLAQREKVAVRTVQTQAAASVSQMAQAPAQASVRLAQAAGRQQAYLPGMLPVSHQLQVLTPTNNILLTGGNLPGQASVQAVQTCAVDASQLSAHLPSMTTSQPVSYILPAATLGSAHLTQLRPSQASGTGARIFQLQQQQMPQMGSSQAATLPGQAPLPGVSNAGFSSLSYLQGNQTSPASLLPGSMGNPQMQVPLGAQVPASPFAAPAPTIPNPSLNLTSLTSKRPATPSDQLHAAKRLREATVPASGVEPAAIACDSAPEGAAQQESQAALVADAAAQAASGGAEMPAGGGGVPLDKERALRMLAGAALSPFAAAQEGSQGAGHSSLRANLGSSPLHATAASAAG